MLAPGDIVLISNLENNSKLGLILGKGKSEKDFLVSFCKTAFEEKNPDEFSQILIESDLYHFNNNEKIMVELNNISTINSNNLNKLGKIKNSKLNLLLRKFAHYSSLLYLNNNQNKSDYIAPSGKVIDKQELFNMVDASLDMWLTSGRFDEKFREKLGNFLGINYILTVNSGSSANLLAVSALKSHKLGDKKLKDGDEVITVAACFPTTVAPIIQNNLVPVFIDVEMGTYNIDVKQIEKSISAKTKAIFIAHTLGNPFDIERIIEIAEKHDLWVLEDNCDALGSKYANKFTGTFGHISTFSFYPAHHITMGEGGALATNDQLLHQILLSLRDWGRDCFCPPGKDNTCGMRFTRQFGNLPFGYDHKYVYSHLGYNLKITDWQAAIGLAQIEKLEDFIKKRKNNFQRLYDGLEPFEDYFILPKQLEKSDSSWFGFPITVKNNEKFTQLELVKHLEDNKIGTRQLFSGNILRQPLFLDNNIKIRIKNSTTLVSSHLDEMDYNKIPTTDEIMKNTFWIGLWPGISDSDIKHIIYIIQDFLEKQV
jgi:CDP-6-deoxy-D-xylo-4-hexulose-3-dehydrase